MTTEEQRDYWEERYNIEKNKNDKLTSNLENLIKEMRKNGDNYWADRIKNIINK